MTTPTYTAKRFLPSALKNALIMLAAGFVASILCAKVFAAPLPTDDMPSAPPAQLAATSPAKTNDAAAAAALRAMLAGQRTLNGTLPTEPARRP